MQKYFNGPVLIVVAAILWALDGVLRRSLFTLPPATIVFYEHLIGGVLLLPFILRQWRQISLTKSEWLSVGLVSVLSGVAGTLWFTTALSMVHFIPFSVVFLLQKLQPIFAITAARLLLKENISWTYARWAIVALIAAYFVTFKNGEVNWTADKETIFAALFALGAALAWGSSTAFSRFALLRQSPIVVTALRFFITIPCAFILVFLLGAGQSLSVVAPDQYLRLFAIALSTGMVALWIYYRGLKGTQVKVATLLELVFPVTAVFIDIFLYKTILAPSQYIAAAVLFFAVTKVSQLNKKNLK